MTAVTWQLQVEQDAEQRHGPDQPRPAAAARPRSPRRCHRHALPRYGLARPARISACRVSDFRPPLCPAPPRSMVTPPRGRSARTPLWSRLSWRLLANRRQLLEDERRR